MIIEDSSIWKNANSFKAAKSKDNSVNLGIIRSSDFNSVTQEITYIVEVQRDGDKLAVPCRVMRNFGGIYNYEEYTHQAYNYDQGNDELPAFETKAGDTVLVTFLNGDPREGIIIGSIHHPGRERELPLDDGVQYKRMINGVEHIVNKDGEFTVTFRGQPTNLDILSEKPGDDTIPAAEYDEEVGTTFYKFDVDGGWTVSDNATSDPQTIYINKKDGEIVVTSGKIQLKMVKGEEATSLTTKTLDITAADSMKTKTKQWETDSSEFAKLRSPKIAIGTSSVELLQQLVDLIDAIGTQTVITPVGPAAPVSASPQWSAVTQIQSKINSIKGSL